MPVIDDREVEESVYSPTCIFCAHWDQFAHRQCAAFREIPLEIWEAENAHREPYPGDQGIQFAPLEDERG